MSMASNKPGRYIAAVVVNIKRHKSHGWVGTIYELAHIVSRLVVVGGG